MKYPFQIRINNDKRASQLKDDVQIGHYFVFLKDKKVAGDSRLKRLLIENTKSTNKVFPLVNKPIELDGVTITPEPRLIEPIGCVVCDRDLYRAEQDTVNLFIAFPKPPEDLHLNIDCNGTFFTKRNVQLDNGIGIERLSMLLPGQYEAQLSIAEKRIGIPVSFTVAAYTLAPLSARLLSHRLKREIEQLWFELAVESYQKPFADELLVTLTDKGKEIAQIGLLPQSPGYYAGGVKIHGEGPFRLRLIAANDAERVAEVAIPGSRKIERQVTIISELGQEKCFAMMPEANALPLRSGYLTDGKFLATPLTVEKIVTEQRLIQVNADMESVVLVILDLTTGDFRIQKVGDVSAGNTITVMNYAPMSTVFIGGFVEGQPFEGYTTFIKPIPFQLSVEVPKTIRPRTDLIMRLRCEGMETKTIPVLLSIRDERLTATDKPEVSLGAAAKRGIDAAIDGMADRTFTSLTEVAPYLLYRNKFRFFKQLRGDAGAIAAAMTNSRENVFSFGKADGEEDLSLDLEASEDDLLLDLEDSTDTALSLDSGSSSKENLPLKTLAEENQSTTRKSHNQKNKSLRSDFPEVLFYDIVPVSGSKEVVIPLSDSLGTFTVETFAMVNGDWTQNQTTLIVDQPVRVDLELPLAVHHDDTVIARLYAATSSGKARITLTHNGKRIAFKSPLTPDFQKESSTHDAESAEVNTPIELEFYVKSGVYLAKVEDTLTADMDSIEKTVGEPGKFKSYAKELGLFVQGESINLKIADALSLQVLPSLDTPFDNLVTATANYAHLCCEQTAAKILATTFMYLTAKNDGQRNQAEQIILAGIAREQKMILPGRGFAMYPDQNYISEYYSKLAVRYLWKLNQLEELPNISDNLRQAVHQGLSLADQAAKAHKMQRIPAQIQNFEDAYTFAAANKEKQVIRQFIESEIDFSGTITLKNPQHVVANRKKLAYAAASLIALNDLKSGIKLANQVTRQFNEPGRLYSTEDSVAAIALMVQLRKSGLITGSANLRVNGQKMMTTEAAKLVNEIKSVDVLDGVAAIEITRIHEEDWSQFANNFPLNIEFRDTQNRKLQQFKAGVRTDLIVSLPDGYKIGDLVHIALPACLSWIQGGGKVKQFTLDFEGKNELRIPLVVTSPIEGKQHFAVCVRNMFEEERATSPGLLAIT
jgi:hypothetical protein